MADVIQRANVPVNRARRQIERIGLRTYRTYVVSQVYSPTTPGMGEISTRPAIELLPSPKIKFFFNLRREPRRIEISKINRLDYTLDILKGLIVDEAARASRSSLVYGLQVRGQEFVELCTLIDDPRLRPFGWTVEVERTGKRISEEDLDLISV